MNSIKKLEKVKKTNQKTLASYAYCSCTCGCYSPGSGRPQLYDDTWNKSTVSFSVQG